MLNLPIHLGLEHLTIGQLGVVDLRVDERGLDESAVWTRVGVFR